MSREALSKIREAEAEADAVRARAETEARRRTEQCERDNAARLAAATEKAEADRKAAIAELRRRADELVAQSRGEADGDIRALEDAARERMPEAVRQIEWEIFDSCL